MPDNLVKLRIIGLTDHIIERVHTVDSEISLYDVLREALKDWGDTIQKLSDRIIKGTFILIINGLTVYRFSDIRDIKVKPGDEVAILPVVFGGCKQL
ncbi:MAG: MoaD/ThiS family protein [Candidatus Caldarchaeales archaeon]